MSKTTLRWFAALALLVGRGFADVHVAQRRMTAWLGNAWPVEDTHPKPE